MAIMLPRLGLVIFRKKINIQIYRNSYVIVRKNIAFLKYRELKVENSDQLLPSSVCLFVWDS